MNEARVYADGFERSFAEVKDLLEFLAERGRNAKWIRKPTNTLRLAPLEKEAQNLDAADASMEEILEDTEKNTQLVLKMRGESYPVRDCAIRTILSRAGVNGDGLRKLDKATYAKVVNYCLRVAKGDALIKIADGKVSAVHGGDKHDYCILDMKAMFETTCEYLNLNFKGSVYMEGSGIYDHSIVSAIQEIERYCNEHEMALTNIFTDQETGKNFNRPRYTVLVEDVLRPGDILIVTELDRLGRNKYDTMQQIQRIKNMGVRLMVLELPTTLMDLSVMDNAMARMMLETINNMMLELYASMAQAELEKKEKRQREGIEAKKLRGEWDDYGRPSVMKQETFDENFQSVVSGETTPTQLRKNLGMTHSTFYRYRKTFYEKYPELSNSAN